MTNTKSAKKTLLLSVIMSSPGPLIVGLGLLSGQSSTQLADFFRRSIELLAIILSFAVFCITSKDGELDEGKKAGYERGTNIFVSCAMMICGAIMAVLALTSSGGDKGNVLPGFIIAVLGVVANGLFWRKYKRLGLESDSKILLTQSKLYRAKTFVDGSVVIALGTILISDNSAVAFWFDLIGTVCVSAYLIFTGVKSLALEILQKNGEKNE